MAESPTNLAISAPGGGSAAAEAALQPPLIFPLHLSYPEMHQQYQDATTLMQQQCQESIIQAREQFLGLIMQTHQKNQASLAQMQQQYQDASARTEKFTLDLLAQLQQHVDQMYQRVQDSLVEQRQQIQDVQAGVARVLQATAELQVLISNHHAQADRRAPLFNPTAVDHSGHAPKLVPPNPRTYYELVHFNKAQCMASAKDLGLPALPPTATVQQRKWQLAVCLGVTLT